MNKVLLIKTSSLGDLIHSFPAVNDVALHRKDVELHWLVEENFANVPLWHPSVKKVHTVAIRRWRKELYKPSTYQEIAALKKQLLAEKFDLVIDGQGLLKTAWIARWFQDKSIGYDKTSIKEPLASKFYHSKLNINKDQKAIARMRQLLGKSLSYDYKEAADFGLQVKKPADASIVPKKPYAVFLHGTNWSSKIWPVEYWQNLAQKLQKQGLIVLLPWGDATEKQRAEAIAKASSAKVLPKSSLDQLAYCLQQATVVVGSDTGLSHISAALGTKTIGLYGASNSALTGLIGSKATSLQADFHCSPCLKRECPLVKGNEIIPCYKTIGPEVVAKALGEIKP